MQRYEVMQDLKRIYEEVIADGDARLYLNKTDEVEHLFNILYSNQGEPYDSNELALLECLSRLNASIESLVSDARNRMQKSHNMSPVITRHYEQAADYSESYFYDKKL
ncbi:hypothetical protein [Paenibacillus sp. NPDC093718]|uniref:hypothetical protein n=1 Tax=Paenibacillus sp. NPDC093718 TaxID=3390601 RepID=UPI003D01F1CC